MSEQSYDPSSDADPADVMVAEAATATSNDPEWGPGRAGYVYILFNPSYPDLVKIGRTTRSVRERAKRLSRSSGVPTPFIVVWYEHVDDCVVVESAIHERLRLCRVHERREFFRLSLRDAIEELRVEVQRVCGQRRKVARSDTLSAWCALGLPPSFWSAAVAAPPPGQCCEGCLRGA